MNNPECFYLHLEGEQRGPYTVGQIDHLLNSGLIGEETLFWREGMEQWQLVTLLVARRKPSARRKWVKRGIAAALFAAVALVVRVFGPVTVDGWRETAQYHFTPQAAYWRARDIVRHQAMPPGTVIYFTGFKTARVEMAPAGDGAAVWLGAQVPAPHGPPQHRAWEVRLRYDERLREWSGLSVKEASP